MDLDSGRSKKIFKDEFKNFYVQEDGSILYTKQRKDEFGCEIWQWNNDKIKLKTIDTLITEIRKRSDKYIIVNKSELGSWNISEMTAKNFEIAPILDSPWVENKLSISDNGFYFSGNYNSEIGIYHYNLNDNILAKVSTGNFADDAAVLNDKLYYKTMRNEGQKLVWNKLSHEEIELPEAEKIPESFEPKITKKGNAFFKNFAYLFWPDTHLNPIYISTSDGIGYNSYYSIVH